MTPLTQTPKIDVFQLSSTAGAQETPASPPAVPTELPEASIITDARLSMLKGQVFDRISEIGDRANKQLQNCMNLLAGIQGKLDSLPEQVVRLARQSPAGRAPAAPVASVTSIGAASPLEAARQQAAQRLAAVMNRLELDFKSRAATVTAKCGTPAAGSGNRATPEQQLAELGKVLESSIQRLGSRQDEPGCGEAIKQNQRMLAAVQEQQRLLLQMKQARVPQPPILPPIDVKKALACELEAALAKATEELARRRQSEIDDLLAAFEQHIAALADDPAVNSSLAEFEKSIPYNAFALIEQLEQAAARGPGNFGAELDTISRQLAQLARLHEIPVRPGDKYDPTIHTISSYQGEGQGTMGDQYVQRVVKPGYWLQEPRGKPHRKAVVVVGGTPPVSHTKGT